MTTTGTDIFSNSIRFAVMHKEQLGSILEGLKASLTDNRIRIVGGKISKFIVR